MSSGYSVTENNEKMTTTIDINSFINCIKDHPAIWHLGEKDRLTLSAQIWSDLATQHDTDVESVKRYWRSLRDKYVKERRKMDESAVSVTQASGVPLVTHSYVPSWAYFRQLDFLKANDEFRRRNYSKNYLPGLSPTEGSVDSGCSTPSTAGPEPLGTPTGFMAMESDSQQHHHHHPHAGGGGSIIRPLFDSSITNPAEVSAQSSTALNSAIALAATMGGSSAGLSACSPSTVPSSAAGTTMSPSKTPSSAVASVSRPYRPRMGRPPKNVNHPYAGGASSPGHSAFQGRKPVTGHGFPLMKAASTGCSDPTDDGPCSAFAVEISATLDRLNPRKRALAKLKIMQVLYDAEFGPGDS